MNKGFYGIPKNRTYVPSISPFPYTGSAGITGSLTVIGSTNITGSTTIAYAPTSPTENVLTVRNTNTSTNAFSTIALGSDYVNGPVDIRLADTNTQGIRIYASNTPLTTTPNGAGFQFFNNATTAFPGQVYFDSGANISASIIFRTAVTSGIITERMRIFSDGNVGINANSINNGYKLDVSGSGRFTNELTVTGSLSIQGDIIPGGPYTANTSSYNLGSPTAAWKDIYVSNGSLVFISGSTSSSIKLGTNGTVNLTGSLQGTASWATNAITSSYPISVTGSTLYSVRPSTNLLNTNNSIFFGGNAGQAAYNANNSIFLGQLAGTQATNANQSIFLGIGAGNGALDAAQSTFIGVAAGQNALSASFSTLIGYYAGYAPVSTPQTSIGSNNIIIGTNISLPDNTRNSINLGAIIFATGSYSTTTGNPQTGSQYGIGRVGINKVSPQYTLDVSGSGNYSNGLTVTGSLVATSFTGSLQGTSSWANNASTASFVNTLNQSVNITGDVTSSIFSSTNNGNGTNFKVGDDAWIGDINTADTLGIKGQQNGTKAYIKFGSGSSNPILGSGGTSTLELTGEFALASGSITVTTGSIIMPNRPAFSVYGSGTTNNLTTTQNGDGTLNQNNFTVTYSQGSGFDSSTGIFTAPVAGLYQVTLVGRNSGYSGGISQLAVVKNNSNANGNVLMIEWASSSTMNHTGGGQIFKLAVNDTLRLKVLAGQINFDGNDNWSVAYIG